MVRRGGVNDRMEKRINRDVVITKICNDLLPTAEEITRTIIHVFYAAKEKLETTCYDARSRLASN
jgi:hypothetical protein